MDSASKEIPTLQLQLFGAPEIRLAGVTYPGLAAKTQALLFYLGMTRRPHLRTALAALLWADMPERDAPRQLAQGDPAIAGAVRRLSHGRPSLAWLAGGRAVLGGCRRIPRAPPAGARRQWAGRCGVELPACGPALRRGIPRGVLCAERAGVRGVDAGRKGSATRDAAALPGDALRVMPSRRTTSNRRSRSPGASSRSSRGARLRSAG